MYLNFPDLEEMLDASVAEVISKLVSNPKFSDLIRNKINMEVDTSIIHAN